MRVRLQTDLPRTRLTPSPWPHRLAWALACATFPLIWVGGLVTTYGAGMAVPDWPNTFGYNLFLYPLESWLQVGDVCLEHSHRLIGAAVGLLTIAVAVSLWRLDGRRWAKWLGVAALAGVIGQGTLGGLRVVEDQVFLAKVHGCTAPVFFALSASLVTFTAARWREAGKPSARPLLARLRGIALFLAIAVYGQIVVGAQLRHLPADMHAGLFRFWVWVHVILALALLLVVLWVARFTAREFRGHPVLVRRARWLLWLLIVQLGLGAAAWVTHYNWPMWLRDSFWAIQYTVVASGRLQATLTTAHVGIGSLAMVTALSMALWSWRLLHGGLLTRISHGASA